MGFIMFKYKENPFLFEVKFIQDEYELHIVRGKVRIKMQITKAAAENEKLLKKFIRKFINDLEVRRRLTLIADPLNSSGFVDLYSSQEFIGFELEEANDEVSQFLEKAELGEVTKNDYINLMSRKDRFSRMRFEELLMRVDPKFIKEVMTLPYKRLQARAMRWLLRGLSIHHVMEKMRLDRIKKNY